MSRTTTVAWGKIAQQTNEAFEKGAFNPKEYATPIGDRVLVKVKNKEIKTESGLLVAQTNPVLPIYGIVVAIGDDRKIQCRVGDRVVFDKYAGVEVKLNGDDHIVMFAHEVLGIIDEK